YITDDFTTSVISNVSTNPYNTKENAIELLSSQLISPVKYKHSIVAHASEIDAMIEFGNGAVLKGMNRKIIKSVPTLSVSDMKTLEATLEALND
ncbi:MAG: malonyl CoA-acyl carrier protein transacylase, partial [Arcobacteraceae bacterium]